MRLRERATHAWEFRGSDAFVAVSPAHLDTLSGCRQTRFAKLMDGLRESELQIFSYRVNTFPSAFEDLS